MAFLAAAAVVTAGTTAYSAYSANKTQNKANDIAKQQADIAKQLFGEAMPLRRTTLAHLLDFVGTGNLPIALQSGLEGIRTQGREGLESQYNVARENILGLTPARGGQLTQGLLNLEDARARSVGGFDANLQANYELPLRQALFGQAGSAGFGQTVNAMAGLNAAGSNLTNLAGTAGLQAQGSGQATGSLLALALKKQQQQQKQQTTSGSSLNYLNNATPYYATQSPLGGGLYT